MVNETAGKFCMLNHDDAAERELYRCISRGYEWLFSSGKSKGNWKYISHTSLVALAFTLREPHNSPWLNHIRHWLMDQQMEMEPNVASWDEEIAETAFAIIALLRMGVLPTDPKIKKAYNYLDQIFHSNGRPNWQDEPWETSWTVLAIAEGNDRDMLDEAHEATKWLMTLQSPTGCIIAPHYSGYFVKINNTMSKRKMMDEKDQELYSVSSYKAVQYLLNNIDKEKLWTGEPWSNGQILFALASTDNFPMQDKDLMNTVVNWFVKKQDANGCWCDGEDTACSILGLVSLLKGYLMNKTNGQTNPNDVDTIIYNHLRSMYETPKLSAGIKLIEAHDDGSTSINLSSNTKKAIAIILSAVGTLLLFASLWDYIKSLLGI